MGKYKRDKGLQIPMEQRQNLNAKILYLVENHETELYGITPEDIFNVYMVKEIFLIIFLQKVISMEQKLI